MWANLYLWSAYMDLTGGCGPTTSRRFCLDHVRFCFNFSFLKNTERDGRNSQRMPLLISMQMCPPFEIVSKVAEALHNSTSLIGYCCEALHCIYSYTTGDAWVLQHSVALHSSSPFPFPAPPTQDGGEGCRAEQTVHTPSPLSLPAGARSKYPTPCIPLASAALPCSLYPQCQQQQPPDTQSRDSSSSPGHNPQIPFWICRKEGDMGCQPFYLDCGKRGALEDSRSPQSSVALAAWKGTVLKHSQLWSTAGASVSCTEAVLF